MALQRNHIYKLLDLSPGDRFHFPGKKNTLATLIELAADPITGELVSAKVQKDGEQFPSYLKPGKEVVYLRNIHQKQ